jgi:hypothetical protein
VFERLQKQQSPETPHEFRLLASIGPDEAFPEEDRARFREGAENLFWKADMKTMRELDQANAGSTTYIISSISNGNKFSEGYENCTGLVVTGVDDATGENISFMTHQRPGSWLAKDAEVFERDCRERLAEFRARARGGTIDAVIVGGDTVSSAVPAPRVDVFGTFGYGRDFKKGVQVLAALSHDVLGIEPRVVGGPLQGQSYKGSTAAYLDTAHRRLFVLRPDNVAGAVDIPAKEASKFLRKSYWSPQ